MITHLTTHKELSGSKILLSELSFDHTTGSNITWGTQPNYIQRVAAHEFIKYQDLKKIQPGHLRGFKQNMPIHTRRFIESGIPQQLLDPLYTTNDSRQSVTDEVSFVRKKWFEPNCGEAMVFTTTYSPVSGRQLPIEDRTGLLDAKLRVVSQTCHNQDLWLLFARYAVGSCYGFSLQGDVLFLARVNILNSVLDAFKKKFNRAPDFSDVEYFAHIISWNFFQLDGSNLSVPHHSIQHGAPLYTPIAEEADPNSPVSPIVYDWEHMTTLKLKTLMESSLK